jgi:F0F1-type ATP synthase membrane subunit b/b'
MSIYVISNDLNIKNNLFKVGRTKDTNTEIVTKYQRYLSGARLLLWYPSNLTNYVEDEKEILRFFDLNRNYTPNGFKNEWLSISFEQLKTKMDEYFGRNGENFEEAQKHRNNKMTQFICEFCNKQLSTKFNLTKHIQVCKQKIQKEYVQEFELLKKQHETQCEQFEKQHETQREQFEKEFQTQREQFEKEFQTQREQFEKEFQTQREQFEKEIQALSHQNEQLQQQVKELQTQIFEIAKSDT